MIAWILAPPLRDLHPIPFALGGGPSRFIFRLATRR
jgi:hypothetical protein